MKFNFYKVLLCSCLFTLSNFALSAYASNNIIEIVTEDDLVQQGGSNTAKISKLVLEKMGYKVKVTFIPWARAFKLAKEGEFAGIAGIYYKPERELDFAYTNPIMTTELLLFSKKSKSITFGGNLRTLSDLNIGIVRDYFYGKTFDEANYLTTIKAVKPEHNIRMLLADRVDVIIESQGTMQKLISANFPNEIDNIEAIYPPVFTQKVYFAFSKKNKNYEVLVNDFNNKLKLLKKMR